MSERALARLGWVATLTALLMYGSYLDQIRLNLAGDKGSVVLPAATALNATLWFSYGFLRPRRDWPLMLANAPGIVLSLATLVTAL